MNRCTRRMPSAYGRDLDLNLLRVFAMVAEAGSVAAAASRLYSPRETKPI